MNIDTENTAEQISLPLHTVP